MFSALTPNQPGSQFASNKLFFFSQLTGKPILDRNNEKVATLVDLIVRINPELGKSQEKYPPVAGLLAHTNRRNFWIPAEKVTGYSDRGLQLQTASISLERFERRDGEILLSKDLLDKQLVDIEGRRVIRVNDMALSQLPAHSELRLVAIDISFRAILRRAFTFGGTPPSRRINRNENLLDWADVEYFATSAPSVRLNVSHERLAKLHPVDLARLLDDLSYVQGSEIVNFLDDETAANALEEMTSDDAADLLEGLSEERAADILEEMEPDNAADVIADLNEARAEAILRLMDEEESQEVRELLAYPKDSAGGIMTNDFLMLPHNLTLQQALRQLRQRSELPEFVDYVYVVEPDSERLWGVAALRDMVFYPERNALLSRLTIQNYVSVTCETSAKEAAAVLAEYGFRAIPVIDDSGSIKGIITFDDAMDLILPQELRRRVPQIFKYHRGMASLNQPFHQ